MNIVPNSKALGSYKDRFYEVGTESAA